MEVITVTSKGQDPSRFISNFTNSIRFSEDYEVGLLKIAYPPVINVSDKNNKIYISKKGVKTTATKILFDVKPFFVDHLDEA